MATATPVALREDWLSLVHSEIVRDLPPEWDEYVLRHPLSTPFHLAAWKSSIEATFGYEPMYILARREGRLCGVLPLFLVRNFLTGAALISTPFAVYGGALAEDAAAYAALAQRVTELGNSLGVQYVELRNAHPEQALGFAPVDRYVTFTQQIGAKEDDILNTIPRKTRRMVRKALAEPYSLQLETEDPRRFEDIYLANLRRLGTPAFPSSHFRNLLHHFKGSVEIREYRLGEAVAAAVLTFYFKGAVLPYYGASDPAFNASAPNNYMYFDLMRSAGASGFHTFDFGRSKKDTGGSYDFKAHWGMMERPLPYEILLVRRKRLPNMSPANPIFQLPMHVWRRLPLWLTRKLGPALIRLVP